MATPRFSALWYVALIFSLVTHSVQATPGPCGEEYSVLAHVERAPEVAFNEPTNVIANTKWNTVISAVIWLTGVQLIRAIHGGDASVLWSSSFGATLPVDVVLTVLTHVINLGHLPWLTNLFSGKAFGPRYEGVARIGASAVLGTSVILATWFLAGIPVTAETSLGAVALCTGVYPTLYVVKTGLFRHIPNRQDRGILQGLESQFGEELAPIVGATYARADALGVPRRQAENMILSAVNGSALAIPYENRVLAASSAPLPGKILELAQEVRNLAQQQWRASQTDADVVWSSRNFMKRRRALVDSLLAHYEKTESASVKRRLEEILTLGNLSNDSSVSVHQVLSRRARQRSRYLFAASLADQAIAVGVAGGVFLYGVTHWANTGETPWFALW